jgi:hypothetical protein
MRQQVKSIIWFGLTIDVIIVGGTLLSRFFYNEAPVEFHKFVEASLWVTIAAGALCAVFIIQIYRTIEKAKRLRVKGRANSRAVTPRIAAKKSQKADSSVLLGVLIMAPGAFIIIPLIHGSVVFAHDYLRLAREFVVFVILWFCYKAYNLTKKSLQKVIA